MSRTHVTCTVNGDEVDFLTEDSETLLHALRDEVGLTGAKEGCSTGDCGACTVVLNGRIACSCLVFAPEAQGATIDTIEGMADGDHLHPLQQSFLENAALQCAICTPGFLLTAKALLEAQPRPDRDGDPLRPRRQPLPLHRLRQDRASRPGGGRHHEGGDRMTVTADQKTDQKTESPGFKSIGTRPIRPDGFEKVTGRAKFGADLRLPGMLEGAILRSPHAHARIRSIDTTAAAAMPGVKAIVTGADFPEPSGKPDDQSLQRNIIARDKASTRATSSPPSPRRAGARPAPRPRPSSSTTRCCPTCSPSTRPWPPARSCSTTR